jgi:hypothetical protein
VGLGRPEARVNKAMLDEIHAPLLVFWAHSADMPTSKDTIRSMHVAQRMLKVQAAVSGQSLPERGQAEMRQSVGGKSRPCNKSGNGFGQHRKRLIFGVLIFGVLGNFADIQIRKFGLVQVRLSSVMAGKYTSEQQRNTFSIFFLRIDERESSFDAHSMYIHDEVLETAKPRKELYHAFTFKFASLFNCTSNSLYMLTICIFG